MGTHFANIPSIRIVVLSSRNQSVAVGKMFASLVFSFVILQKIYSSSTSKCI